MGWFEECLSEVEQTQYFRFPFQVATIFEKYLRTNDSTNDQESFKNAGREHRLFSLQTPNPLLNNTEEDSHRFSYSVALSDGTIWPDPEDFDEEDLSYFMERLESTSNAFLRARYADYLFEYGTSVPQLRTNKYKLALILVPAYLTTAKKHFNSDQVAFVQAFSDIYRAAEVAISINNDELMGSCVDLLREQLQIAEHDKEYRWVLDMSKVVRVILASPLSDSISEDVRDTCTRLLADGQKWLDGNDYIPMRVYFIKELIEWKDYDGLPPEKENQLQILIGSVYENHAAKQADPWIKAHFYEQARDHFERIDRKGDADRVKIIIRQIYEALSQEPAVERGFTTRYLVPADSVEAEQNMFLLDDVDESLNRISGGLTIFFPNVAEINQRLDAQFKLAPLYSRIHKQFHQDGRTVFKTIDDDDLKLASFAEQYRIELSLRIQMVLLPVFQRLIRDKGMSAEDVISFIEAWPLLHRDNQPFLRHGITRFFEGDHIGSLHVLVPQFESCLRRAFAKQGFVTTIKRSRGRSEQEQTFGNFLDRTDIKEELGEDLHQAIRFVMVDLLGMNLRNNIGHGLISAEACNEVHSCLVVVLFLVLKAANVRKQEHTKD